MIIYRATALDTPQDPFTGAALRAETDGGIAVNDGVITARGPYAEVRASHPDAAVLELRDGLLLPSFIDTHVHYPQLRIIGALGMPLLDWLERCALPEEARLAEVGYARSVAGEFVRAMIDSGTTSALVFGAHFAPAVDEVFVAAAAAELRITTGLVVSDRMLRAELHTSPDRAYAEGLALARRWHGVGHARYAVTPRFALSCSDELLAACADLHKDVAGSWFTSHINENPAEIATVRELFGTSYLEAYTRHAVISERSVLAHNVHPTDAELDAMAALGASVAHCPTSNAALGSGLFPLGRHLAHGVAVALGSDVGAGTGLSLFKEGLQAYFVQQLLGAQGVQLTAAHLLYLATAAGAAALGQRADLGDLSPGRRFDAVWVRPVPDSTLAAALRNAHDADDALAKTFALATAHDVAGVWIDGSRVKPDRSPTSEPRRSRKPGSAMRSRVV